MQPGLSESNEKLNKSVVECRQKLGLCPVGSPSRSRSLGELAKALYDRFRQLGETWDLEEAITYCRRALDLCPSGHPDHSQSLNDLANTVKTRFDRWGQIEDLNEAITCSRQALDHCPPGHPNRSHSLNSLAIAIRTRFDQRGQIEDLEEAITYYREALDLCPPGHPNRSISLINLAIAVLTHFSQRGQIEDLEEAITCNREALDHCPPGHPNRSHPLLGLAATVRTRFSLWGKIEDLEEAITCHHEALDLCPPGHSDRSSSLNGLAVTLWTRFNLQGQIEDLEEMITCHREALNFCPLGHPHRSDHLMGLAAAVCTRFNLQGKIEDVEEAITCNRQALDLCPPGHPSRSRSLSNLALTVHTRFNQQGQIEDLEEAITCNRQALDLHPPGHPDRSMILNNLGVTVGIRFDLQGQIEDLEEAITWHTQALDLRPPGHPDRSMSLNNLGGTAVNHFNLQGQIEDLEEAITWHHQALDLCPPGHPNHCLSLHNLAAAVFTRFKRRGQIGDLEEAITCNHQVLDLCPPGHPYRPVFLKDLASAISSRFHWLGSTSDLEEAIKYLSEAEHTLPVSHPLHADFQSDLASAYLLQHESRPQPDACLPLAFRLFESAANHSTATLKDRFDAALEWAQQAQHHQHHTIFQAYSVSLTLLDRRLNVTPDVESQQHLLATTPSIPRSLASDAASSAIDVGQLETAVELLEQGRGILWSKLRGYRHPLEQLRDVDGQLARRFEILSGQLEHLATMSARSDLTPPGQDKVDLGVAAFEAYMRQHRILSEEWDEVVGRIRQVEGFTNFLQAVPFPTLQLAAAEGPVIIVNISEYRSDAIILRGMDPPVLVPLPNTSPQDLALLSSQLSNAVTTHSLSNIHPVLRWLWDTVVGPVGDKLAILGVAERSRIWWCPTSELCSLPLHAAGPYKHGAKNLPDIYISSYVPTLSTLIRARSGIVNRSSLPNFLVMGQPGENLEVGVLPNVKEEIRRIHSFGDFVDVLVAGDANRQTVLPHLQDHNWIHFACHGHQELQPFHSSFELYGDERLTLIDLMKARFPNAEFAFLSACHSAAGNTGNTPDEVINLAAALQFCGFRSVVGTLWAMADIDGPDVAEDFYRYMFRDFGSVDFRDSAKALNLATRAMRKRKRMTIDRWINFVHIGA